MMNQELKAQRRKYEMLPNFGICCRELGDSKLRVCAHACAVSALSNNDKNMFSLMRSIETMTIFKQETIP